MDDEDSFLYANPVDQVIGSIGILRGRNDSRR